MPRRDHEPPAPHATLPRAARRSAVFAVAVALALAGCSAAVDAPAPGAVPDLPSAAPGAVPEAPPSEPADGLDGVDADLAARFEAARAAAAAEDVELRITSGKRTEEEQQRLVDQAVAQHGVPEAYRWVLPPEKSAHVQGLAIDVGATQGAYWLAEHGLEFGLCQTYANEVWHFEKLPDGADTCPEQHPDSSWGW